MNPNAYIWRDKNDSNMIHVADSNMSIWFSLPEDGIWEFFGQDVYKRVRAVVTTEPMSVYLQLVLTQ